MLDEGRRGTEVSRNRLDGLDLGRQAHGKNPTDPQPMPRFHPGAGGRKKNHLLAPVHVRKGHPDTGVPDPEVGPPIGHTPVIRGKDPGPRFPGWGVRTPVQRRKGEAPLEDRPSLVAQGEGPGKLRGRHDSGRLDARRRRPGGHGEEIAFGTANPGYHFLPGLIHHGEGHAGPAGRTGRGPPGGDFPGEAEPRSLVELANQGEVLGRKLPRVSPRSPDHFLPDHLPVVDALDEDPSAVGWPDEGPLASTNPSRQGKLHIDPKLAQLTEEGWLGLGSAIGATGDSGEENEGGQENKGDGLAPFRRCTGGGSPAGPAPAEEGTRGGVDGDTAPGDLFGMNHRERLRDLLVERSLRVGDFVLASGARSTYYIDARKTLFSAEGQALVGRVGLDVLRLRGLNPAWVGGLTMGADPVSLAIAHRSWEENTPVNAFSVRKEAKTHGAGSRIEGGLPPGVEVVVTEDTLTTGGSALRAVAALEAHGVQVLAVLAVVDRESGGEEALAERGIPLVRLYTATELLAASPRP